MGSSIILQSVTDFYFFFFLVKRGQIFIFFPQRYTIFFLLLKQHMIRTNCSVNIFAGDKTI